MTNLSRSLIKTIYRTLASRLLQVTGNVMKAIMYLHFRLLPRARFSIPASAPAWWPSSRPRKIPRIVWQTNYTAQVTLPIYLNYLWNRLMSPTHEHRFCDDEACDAFIRLEFPPQTYATWSRLQIGAAKADFWRVLALLHHGGIYMDMDAGLCWPAESLVSSQDSELFIRNADASLTNFFMASMPGNPLLAAIAEKIMRNIKENNLKSVFDMTGPTVLIGVVDSDNANIDHARIVCRQGLLTSKMFQYPNNLKGYWVKDQQNTSILK
jgi:mannosyltransferase OCH1-like enzyme